MLADVVDHLRCPVCAGGLHLDGRVVRCVLGHAFDLARQGYVSLLTGSQAPGTADSAAMVAARDSFLGAGHFGPLAEAVAAACRDGAKTVADAGAGTGYYLAGVLDRLPGAVGLALDISKHAIRRAARAHPRLGAVVADVWRPLPVADGTIDVLLNVFAPRNGAEFARVLREDGELIVVTPTARHLAPLVERLGLLSVDASKERRVAESLGDHFVETGRSTVEFEMTLGHAAVEAVAGMGPSAWHLDTAAVRRKIEELPMKSLVTASFQMSVFGRRQ
ncbi:23S rRNA (guanine745-N1)-methyltransferase [Streptosporangium becharense]|uniref:23S rRNA (Guanine745-N1)-methyltransferase n=1 Tax=Streptosporangium becharense TaxID=1816182 RepID=A0A7W9IG05_9ACTN|nr:methyltransferase domain-containing protein [Streptosporangium becharense]MBB2908930.1 23S rRNA (guanine745-N1)-methyltransferase [Streptosporangium becharense]MBB5820052.1 23S rRNA (guanine745-N1)-methyltransferase [Streptosporangium becharense]